MDTLLRTMRRSRRRHRLASHGSVENRGSGRRAVLLAVAVATAGVLPGFLTGGLAVQIRGELGFGEGALGFAVAVFFAASALASVVSGRVVERLGSSLGMRLAAVASAASLLAVSVLASWRGCHPRGGGYPCRAGYAAAQPHSTTQAPQVRDRAGPGRPSHSVGYYRFSKTILMPFLGLSVIDGCGAICSPGPERSRNC